MSTIKRALSSANDNNSSTLTLLYEGKPLTRGEQIDKIVPKVAPGLKISATEKAPYIVVCLDLDAPFVKTPFLSPIVHWIQSGLNAGAGEDALLQSQVSPIVNWLPPSPPPISGPHRYLFMVFAQPSDFDLTRWNAAFKKPVSTWSRVRWNIDQFVQEAGLEDIVAATFFGSV